MASDAAVNNGPASYKTLAICWIVYGIFRIAAAIWLVSFTPIATVMFGALLVRVRDAESMMSAFHSFYAFSIVLSAVCGVIGLLAGLALLAGQRLGRILALIAAFLSLSELPLGITLGVYTLLALLRPTRSLT
jgi:hypothetical protein